MAEDKVIDQRIRESLRALRHRNYRIYFFAMLVSFTGTWMQSVAQSWLIYRLTGSAWLLGLVGFVGQVPVFLFAPVGGVLADRHNRHHIVILTQGLAMTQALVLAILTLSGHVTVGAVLVLALMLGVVNAFDLPTRQSFVAELVDKRDLMNAIALNSSMINSARVLGPALAGVIVAWSGEGVCFLINGLSFMAVLAGLFAMKLNNGLEEKPAGSALADFKEGFLYVHRTKPVRELLLLVAFVSIFGLSYIVLMPIFAKEILNGGSQSLGVLLGAAGIGALGGALTLAARRHADGLGRVAAASVAAVGVALILFSVSRNVVLSAALLVPIGFALMLQMSASNTLLQTIVPDRMRGRVMSFYSMSLMGMVPFGNLFAGAVASRVGAPNAVALGGALCLGAALFFALRLQNLKQDSTRVVIGKRIGSGEQSETDAA